MYIFKYHPDNTIYRNGKLIGTYAEFLANNVGFPLVPWQFFEYRNDGFDLINNHGHHIPQEDLSEFQGLIQAIEALNE